MAECQVDFLPPSYKERRSRRRTWLVRGGVVLILAVAMSGASFAVHRKSERLGGELDTISSERDRTRNRIAQVEQLDKKKQELARRLGVLEEILSRARGSLVLDSVSRSCGESVMLNKVNLRLDTKEARPFVQISIEGFCSDHLDVANLQGSLADELLLHDVNVVLSEKVSTSDQRIKFVVTARSPGELSAAFLEKLR